MRSRSRAGWLCGLFATLGLAGCGGRAAEKTAAVNPAPKAVTVTVEATSRKEVERTIEVVGSLRGWEQVTLGIKKEGRVHKVFRDMGDRVKPGEPLIEMETEDADLAVRQAERRFQVELAKLGLRELPKGDFDVSALPSVLQPKAALEKAKRLYERERSLIQRNAGAMQDFQNAESDERAAEAALANAILTAQSTLANAQSARVALEIAQHDRREMEIRAPVPTHAPEGVTGAVTYAISKRSVSEGQMVRVGDAVVELVIEKPLRLWANVPERFSADVKLRQPVRVTVSTYPGTAFDGEVARINPSVETASRTFQVEALVPNNRGLLRPGGFAKASILTDRHAEATVVPVESIVEYAGVTKLFVVEDGKARAVSVEKGQEGTGWVEVIGAVPAGAVVVVTGQTQLAEGTTVTVRGGEPAKAVARSR